MKCRQVMERVDVVESASVNEAHEEIPDVGAGVGQIKQTVLAMLNHPLKNLFAKGMPTA